MTRYLVRAPSCFSSPVSGGGAASDAAEGSGRSVVTTVHILAMQSLEDSLEDLLCSRHHVVVPKPKNTEPRRPQKAIAAIVVRHSIDMLASVQFDDDGSLDADEVTNVETDLMLPTKLEPAQLAAAQTTPEPTFGVGRILSEVADMAKHVRS
jgi:hypothetical protein